MIEGHEVMKGTNSPASC